MLSNKEFDLWANDYDKSVNLSEEANTYPFAGYKNVLGAVYSEVRQSESASVLDIGFGTAVLTKKLYDDGYNIFGIDFSKKMIDIAQKKMPNAHLLQYDFTKGVPLELKSQKFDYIITTYAIHHLTDAQKVSFLGELLLLLKDGGKIVIGDVAFKTKDERNVCKATSAEAWDNDEVYIVFDQFKNNFKNAKIDFEKISDCAGIITLQK